MTGRGRGRTPVITGNASGVLRITATAGDHRPWSRPPIRPHGRRSGLPHPADDTPALVPADEPGSVRSEGAFLDPGPSGRVRPRPEELERGPDQAPRRARIPRVDRPVREQGDRALRLEVD